MQDNVSVEKLSDVEYRVNIQISKENVEKKFDDFFNAVRKEAQIPGFRKGRVPVSHLKRVYYNTAKPTIAQSLVGEYYSKMLQENDINPVGSPTFENMSEDAVYPGEFGFDGTYSVQLLTETLPKFDPEGYLDLDLDIPEHNTEEMIENMMLEYREKFSEHNQVTERGAELGDAMVIDFEGFIDGEPFEGGSSNEFSIKNLGNDHFIPGFEDQIVGMHVGETKDINVTFPDKYRAEHLSGKDATFKVSVHSITEKKLADIDEDLAMMCGFTSIGELNEHIAETIRKNQEGLNKSALDRQIVTKLLEINEFNVPKTMVEGEKRRIVGPNTDINSFDQNTQAELQKVAEYNIKRAIIMDMIYEKEDDIEVTPEKLSDMLEDHAVRNNQTKDELVSNLYNSGQMDSFVGVLRVEEVINYIVNKSKQD